MLEIKECRANKLFQELDDFDFIQSVYKTGSYDLSKENESELRDLDIIIVLKKNSTKSKSQVIDEIESLARKYKIILDLSTLNYDELNSKYRNDNISIYKALVKDCGELILGECIKDIIPYLNQENRHLLMKLFYRNAYKNIKDFSNEDSSNHFSRQSYFKSWPLYLSYLYIFKNGQDKLIRSLGKNHLYSIVNNCSEGDNLLENTKKFIKLDKVLLVLGLRRLPADLEKQVYDLIENSSKYLNSFSDFKLGDE